MQKHIVEALKSIVFRVGLILFLACSPEMLLVQMRYDYP